MDFIAATGGRLSYFAAPTLPSQFFNANLNQFSAAKSIANQPVELKQSPELEEEEGSASVTHKNTDLETDSPSEVAVEAKAKNTKMAKRKSVIKRKKSTKKRNRSKNIDLRQTLTGAGRKKRGIHRKVKIIENF